jgi:cell division protein FtsL
MNSRLAEEKFYDRKPYPLQYFNYKIENHEGKKVLQTRPGLFYILIIVIIFLFFGVFLNVGVKMQSIKYEKQILKINEMIYLEQERSDRLQLKISELKSPSRIISAAENNLKMKISDKLKIIQVSLLKTSNSAKTDNPIEKGITLELKKYDNFLGTIYGIEDIIMVVSGGVLTFFIP